MQPVTQPAAQLSIVIPMLDEERALPATLAAVVGRPQVREILLVDGGSRDGTLAIATEMAARHEAVRLLASPVASRARQMNLGADHATGAWLLFLHADTHLPAAALGRIAALPPAVEAGCLRHRFSGTRPVLRVISWLHHLRFYSTRVIYGDQALFVRRPLFIRLGGFPDRPMEDIAFSLLLRRATRPVMLPETVITSGRKFEQMGPYRALAHVIALLLRFRLGRDVDGDSFFGTYR